LGIADCGLQIADWLIRDAGCGSDAPARDHNPQSAIRNL